MKSNIAHWNKELSKATLKECISFVFSNITGKKKFSTSFGIEDQMLVHILNDLKVNVEVFTLDTGRLFPETYDVFERSQRRYKNVLFQTYFPDEKDIQSYVSSDGINGFYTSIDSRKRCCHIRKVIPLQRALEDVSVWITGLRIEQSLDRSKNALLEWDDQYELIKFNPLIYYTLEEVETFVNEHNTPINALYKKGYLSIGCAPCTRALLPGENFRAGRWSWEQSTKECGLHTKQ